VNHGGETNTLNRTVAKLTPQQLEEAEQLAQNLVKENTNCWIW